MNTVSTIITILAVDRAGTQDSEIRGLPEASLRSQRTRAQRAQLELAL